VTLLKGIVCISFLFPVISLRHYLVIIGQRVFILDTLITVN